MRPLPEVSCLTAKKPKKKKPPVDPLRGLPSAAVVRGVFGYDPGAQGALVALSLISNEARMWRPKQVTVQELRITNLWPALDSVRSQCMVAFIERVNGDPKWGCAQNFAFGAGFGAAVEQFRQHGWPVIMIRPQQWQRDLADGDVPPGDPKHRAQVLYYRLFPHDPLPRNKVGRLDHNAIDALLIAAWGVLALGLPLRPWLFKGGPGHAGRADSGDGSREHDHRVDAVAGSVGEG